jgi:hypothetical protein
MGFVVSRQSKTQKPTDNFHNRDRFTAVTHRTRPSPATKVDSNTVVVFDIVKNN